MPSRLTSDLLLSRYVIRLDYSRQNQLSTAPFFRIEDGGESEKILGEWNPGFTMWTSAHGFSHFRLASDKKWKRFWMIFVGLSTLVLAVCFIFYSYQVYACHSDLQFNN